MASDEDQQFCLRWNNFQANITSQFEALRDDEDFTDVTIACDGQRLQAHKVVLSACSPFFKELFKTNPCPHPIIFMRDVEARHIVALVEFMYAGEVNVAQAHLPAFLKTAESLRIRGLTDTSTESVPERHKGKTAIPQQQNGSSEHKLEMMKQISCSSTVTSSQEEEEEEHEEGLENCSSPKRQCRSETELTQNTLPKESETLLSLEKKQSILQPKMELPDYSSDGDMEEHTTQENEVDRIRRFYGATDLSGGMEIIPQSSNYIAKDLKRESLCTDLSIRKRRLSESWLPFGPYTQNGVSEDSLDLSSSILRNRQEESERRSRLIKLGDGIEVYEDQLRSLKWTDYRKLTRGLATILFSPAELATCSVTGQRWSRAGSGERPVKPALDRSKVQAIISYVATRFPMVEISRIKQVLAYKCKENSTAFKMKAVRYYGDQLK
ncbi:unnamed protein product [Callosobruchus maculatus]|uniref:BTB domain-containing protein n=1 Tax=Callosobruchus maculatus TaxID=64391 RepID=A0A653C6F0_CALMS|nr:unnamed protein product [Callosobruchus maculatus]